MFAVLLSLLGIAAAAAGAGGGRSEEPLPEQAPPISSESPVDDTADGSDHGDHGDMAQDDTADGSDHGDHGDMAQDDTADGSDHGDHDDMAQDDTADGSDHGGHGDMAQDDTTDGSDHGGHGDMAQDDTADGSDHGGHGDHAGMEPTPLPQSSAEIEAFVAAVRTSPETHSHDHGSSMAGEHMAAMDLVPRDEATHIAIASGDWSNPANWYNDEVPGDDALALIPDGVHMTYGQVSDARLLTLRVDGKLDFATDVDSQLVVDTMVVSPTGELTIGTEENPVDPDVDIDIIFANNGAIDTDWDPLLLSRGLIAHGKVEIHGSEKDSHDKVVDDPMAGDTWVDMGTTPTGWEVGDTIVIAGTNYDGYTAFDGYIPAEDEIRIITEIEDGMMFFEDPLVFDHDAPRDDLKTSVANYTRNVSFETEDADLAEIHERGHVMFMHNDDVDVYYAEFHELGRTDKSEPARNVDEFNSIEFDSNVKGRYAFHFHRSGVEDQDDPAMAVGNAVYGSPGWGFVHHDSNAILENNASYDTFGAGYVAESGNETGAWVDNIAIFAQGTDWGNPKLSNDANNFDLATTGDGFWFQGRQVASVDNVAASVNSGFIYFHRGPFEEDAALKFDADTTAFPELFSYHEQNFTGLHPILEFSDNEAFATNRGLYVVKSGAQQGHDVHSVLDDFTAWNVSIGADLSYTAHYTLKDFDIIGKEATDFDFDGDLGIYFGGNTSDMTIVNARIENVDVGIQLEKGFTDPNLPLEANHYTIISPTFINVDTEFANFDPTVDTLIENEDLPMLTPDIALDGALYWTHGDTRLEIQGTKSDSLGEVDFPTQVDSYDLSNTDMRNLIRTDGYYTTGDGQNYYMLDMFFSDRVTGDIYLEKHPVLLDENVLVGTNDYSYSGAPFNGVRDFGGEDDPTIDSAILWATLTDGQLVLSDEAVALEEAEDERIDEIL